MESYVYFLTDDHGHIKIGKSNDIYSRICELQTGNPYKLRLLFSLKMKDETMAFNLEQKLHKLFRKSQLEGEWFEEEEILKFLENDYCEVDGFSFYGRGIILPRYINKKSQ